MTLEAPGLPLTLEADQLLTWEAELETRWAQLQVRRRSAERRKETHVLLEASLHELDSENVAAQLVLEERRRALAARKAQLEQAKLAQEHNTVAMAAELRAKQQTVAERTRAVDAAWRGLERATLHDEAAHAATVRSLELTKQRSLERAAAVRARLDAVRQRETQSLAHLDAVEQRRHRSAGLLRETLAQLQRELEERERFLAMDEDEG